MKKFIKICALTGLILLLAGIGITSVSAALGGRYSSYLPRRIWSMVWDDEDYMEHGWNDDDFPIPMIPVRAGSDGPRTRCGRAGLPARTRVRFLPSGNWISMWTNVSCVYMNRTAFPR